MRVSLILYDRVEKEKMRIKCGRLLRSSIAYKIHLKAVGVLFGYGLLQGLLPPEALKLCNWKQVHLHFS